MSRCLIRQAASRWGSTTSCFRWAAAAAAAAASESAAMSATLPLPPSHS
ncbi:hypothetical protein GMORB2_4618 [Geosmithia morbida]|uniref:Uncharacterized protein n=1 Tax=Geosmithia morbida TaxID=1094350 RepID=A0A9P4YPR6_9HYPO|nr:uncharacterized protein GMORB2_4618 [Geosmithia morbida]KAF4119488.1 hypothetical protein GMORB2_4618 [Geosmithia morbida]